MKKVEEPIEGRWLDVHEIRLISDLRIMHSKVDELFHIIGNLKRRHSETAIHKYADYQVLGEDIERVDEIYLWFLKLKSERERKDKNRRSG